MMAKRLVATQLAGAIGAMLALASPAAAQNCSDLASLELENGHVTGATLVPAGGFEAPQVIGPPPVPAFAALPAFCRIEATMTPVPDSEIGIEIWLPASGDWNGKLVGIGNGVWAGNLSLTQVGEPLSRGYATVTTDTGHRDNALSARWAAGHPERLADFGHRAVHEMTVAAKQAIRAYYGKGPDLSLWHSCSTGGRQGLMSAYRYPADYDIISSLAPANPMTDLLLMSLWTNFHAMRTPGARFTIGKVTALHGAVLKHCDAQDGLRDGIVGDPRGCDFEPAMAQCKAGDADNCLNAAEVGAMRRIYDGPRHPQTGARFFAGFPLGSEMQLSASLIGDQAFPAAASYMGDVVYQGGNWSFADFDVARDGSAGRAFGSSFMDVPATGLGPFFARGGKLLLSHGWNDGVIPASNTLSFYLAALGSLSPQQAQEQLRLFMVPGMDHCGGGEGAWLFDRLSIMEDWAGSGKAPDSIVAIRPPGGLPGAPEQPPISRLVCAFPGVAVYRGGPAEEAGSFDCIDR